MTALIQHRLFLPLTLLFFVAVRGILVWFLPLDMASDGGWYLGRAISIATDEEYAEVGLLTAFWPIGYPGTLGLLFKAFGEHQIVGQIANLFFAVGTFYLMLRLTRILFDDEIAARVAVFLLAIYPNHIAYTPVLVSEMYFTFLILLGSYVYLRHTTDWRRSKRTLVLAGLIFGVAALTKPQALFFPGFLILLDLWSHSSKGLRHKVIMKGVVLYMAMMLLIVPWVVRNTLVFGELVLVSNNGGVTLLAGNNPSADGGYRPDDPLVEAQGFTVKDQVAADQRAMAAAKKWISENKLKFVSLMPVKVWKLWVKDGESEWEYQRGYWGYDQRESWFRSIRVINQLYYLLLGCGFIGSIFLMYTGRIQGQRPWRLLGYGLVIYLSMISAVFFGYPRFHFPAMPWIIIYAALSVSYVLKRDRV